MIVVRDKSKALFITGTGTDVGKTFVTGLIVKKLKENGYDAGYYKAALSGAEVLEKDGEKILIPGDADHVGKIAGINENPEDMVSYIYENAVSPHLASMIEGNPVELSVVKEDFQKVSQKYDYVTVEGSGGILCPIRWDDQKILLEDIIKTLALKTLLIADAGLGTINAVVLTVDYLKHAGIECKGIILNHFHPGDVMEEDNKKMIEEMTGLLVLACVEENTTDLNICPQILAGLYE